MKKILLRALLCLLVLTTVFGSVSCASKGKTLLSLNEDGIKVTFSANQYQLMLSRYKATLAEVQNVNSSDFWDSWIGSPAKTMDDHYRDSILQNCKTYLIALYLFEKYDLSLTATELAEVKDIMNEFILTDGDGSKTKLNAKLSDYGVNYDILEDVYLMQAKIEHLQKHLYGTDASLIGDDIKTNYMTENYVHYKQIFLPFTKFVYETDANGNDVYFKPSESDKNTASDRICYDTTNGNASTKTDKNGDVIYYLEDGKTIAYDVTDGIRKKLVDKDNKYQTTELSDTEKKALKAEKDALYNELKTASEKNFEAAISRVYEQKDLAADQNTDGYYIRRNTYTGASSYLNDVISELDSMQDKDVAVIESEHGYFIIKKYKFTEKAYDLEANKNSWFANFNELVINQVFSELCQPYYDKIVVNEEVYASVPSMKEINLNYFY